MLGIGIGLTSLAVLARRGGGGGGYDPDAQAFFDRLTTQPDDTRKALYNAVFVDLKAAGIFTKLDTLYLLAAADTQAARQNLISASYTLTPVGSPAFTADRGYVGDGTAAYIATGFTPGTATAPKFIQDSASMFTWERTMLNATTSSSLAADSGNRVSLVPRSSGDIVRAALNAALAGATASVTTNVGLSAADRLSLTNNMLLLRNGVLLETVASTTDSTASGAFDLMRRNGTVFRASPMVAAGFGGGLGTPGHLALYNVLNTYLTAVGAL